jgi:ATP-dependent RNA helicase DeaD
MGYQHPTPVQLAVYEPAVRGKSIVVQARTGTGKTTAFGLPILDQLVRKSLQKVQALVLCPTRELALQVSRELEQLARFRATPIVAIYGGASMVHQVEALERGAQVVVGTPGRVLDHIRRGTLDTSHVRIFVLDEADEMLSMGFAKELSSIVETLPKERQGLYFSATIPPDIERMATTQLKEPEFITLSSDQVGALEVAHFVYITAPGDKRGQLIRIIEVEDPESALVFCNTKEETERLTEALKNKGFDADWLNGDLEQNERERVMAKTREGKLRFLVATDVAARGIDVSHLTHVINFDFPDTAEQYVHRTGRTGRAGRTGTAISLVGPRDIGNLYLLRLTYKIRPIERQLPTAGEMKTRAERDLVQLFEEAFVKREVHPDDLALSRRLLTHADADVIVAGLLRDHLGARSGDPVQEAAEARRARNPPAVAAPVRPVAPAVAARPAPRPVVAAAEASVDSGPVESAEPTLRLRLGPGPGPRDRRPPRPERSVAPRLIPHATFTTWEPPEEHDDDEPILGGGKPSSARSPEVAPRAAEPARSVEPARVEDGESDDGFVQVFVNVGRRDGVRATDLQRLLEQGVTADAVGRIRMRDRMTFVAIRKDLVERAIVSLAGQVLGGRTVVAELAKKA